MPMCNSIEHSDNYSDTSGSLWQFKREKQAKENNGNLSIVSTENWSSFKYKSNLIGTISNEGRKNCKVELSLTWNKTWIFSNVANDSNFAITDIKLYVPFVTLKTKDNGKLSKSLTQGFKGPVYWNE